MAPISPSLRATRAASPTVANAARTSDQPALERLFWTNGSARRCSALHARYRRLRPGQAAEEGPAPGRPPVARAALASSLLPRGRQSPATSGRHKWTSPGTCPRDDEQRQDPAHVLEPVPPADLDHQPGVEGHRHAVDVETGGRPREPGLPSRRHERHRAGSAVPASRPACQGRSPAIRQRAFLALKGRWRRDDCSRSATIHAGHTPAGRTRTLGVLDSGRRKAQPWSVRPWGCRDRCGTARPPSRRCRGALHHARRSADRGARRRRAG